MDQKPYLTAIYMGSLNDPEKIDEWLAKAPPRASYHLVSVVYMPGGRLLYTWQRRAEVVHG